MFIPVSMDKYIGYHLEANPGADKTAVREALVAKVWAKQNGAKLGRDGKRIRAVGSAVAGNDACIIYITGEADCTGDFEIYGVSI